jgi:hypothetical protein
LGVLREVGLEIDEAVGHVDSVSGLARAILLQFVESPDDLE